MCFEYQTVLHCHVAGHPSVGNKKVGEVMENCHCGIVTVSYIDPSHDIAYASQCRECIRNYEALNMGQLYITEQLMEIEELDDDLSDAMDAEDLALTPTAEDHSFECEDLGLTPCSEESESDSDSEELTVAIPENRLWIMDSVCASPLQMSPVLAPVAKAAPAPEIMAGYELEEHFEQQMQLPISFPWTAASNQEHQMVDNVTQMPQFNECMNQVDGLPQPMVQPSQFGFPVNHGGCGATTQNVIFANTVNVSYVNGGHPGNYNQHM